MRQSAGRALVTTFRNLAECSTPEAHRSLFSSAIPGAQLACHGAPSSAAAWQLLTTRGVKIPIQGWSEKQKPPKEVKVFSPKNVDEMKLPTVSKSATKMGGIGGSPVHRATFPDRRQYQLRLIRGVPTSAAHLDIEPSSEDMPINQVRQASARWIGWGHKLEPESLFHYNSLNEEGALLLRDRERVIVSRHNLWYKQAFRPLTIRKQRYSGRDPRTGQIKKPEGRYKGGRVNWRARVVDFKRNLWGVPGTVIRQEYAPTIGARLNLVRYQLGWGKFAYSYVLANQGVDVGDSLVSGPDAPLAPGNALPIERIPPGTEVSNVEHPPGKGGKFARASGTKCIIIKHQANKFTQIKMPSGEVRLVYSTGYATVGPIGNPLHKHRKLGNHFINRCLGNRPRVRGFSMENAFHPHGGSHGSQGRNSEGPEGFQMKSKGKIFTRKRFNQRYILTTWRRARFERYGVWTPGKYRTRGGARSSS